MKETKEEEKRKKKKAYILKNLIEFQVISERSFQVVNSVLGISIVADSNQDVCDLSRLNILEAEKRKKERKKVRSEVHVIRDRDPARLYNSMCDVRTSKGGFRKEVCELQVGGGEVHLVVISRLVNNFSLFTVLHNHIIIILSTHCWRTPWFEHEGKREERKKKKRIWIEDEIPAKRKKKKKKKRKSVKKLPKGAETSSSARNSPTSNDKRIVG